MLANTSLYNNDSLSHINQVIEKFDTMDTDCEDEEEDNEVYQTLDFIDIYDSYVRGKTDKVSKFDMVTIDSVNANIEQYKTKICMNYGLYTENLQQIDIIREQIEQLQHKLNNPKHYESDVNNCIKQNKHDAAKFAESAKASYIDKYNNRVVTNEQLESIVNRECEQYKQHYISKHADDLNEYKLDYKLELVTDEIYNYYILTDEFDNECERIYNEEYHKRLYTSHDIAKLHVELMEKDKTQLVKLNQVLHRILAVTDKIKQYEHEQKQKINKPVNYATQQITESINELQFELINYYFKCIDDYCKKLTDNNTSNVEKITKKITSSSDASNVINIFEYICNALKQYFVNLTLHVTDPLNKVSILRNYIYNLTEFIEVDMIEFIDNIPCFEIVNINIATLQASTIIPKFNKHIINQLVPRIKNRIISFILGFCEANKLKTFNKQSTDNKALPMTDKHNMLTTVHVEESTDSDNSSSDSKQPVNNTLQSFVNNQPRSIYLSLSTLTDDYNNQHNTDYSTRDFSKLLTPYIKQKSNRRVNKVKCVCVMF